MNWVWSMTGNSMSQSLRYAWLSLAICIPVSPLYAQPATCKDFSVEESKLPFYPPIAHAAHMEATIRFKVIVPLSGEPQLTFLDGPSQGVWQTLIHNAHDYLDARKYGWFEAAHREPCSYIAAVEYRFTPGEVSPPNNFKRVTVFDETRTVVEVKSTTPTGMY